MVFGLKKLQDDLFCITEERNYFQGKYTEQVSEIAALKEELRKARKEITKLRGELMMTSSSSAHLSVLVDGDHGSSVQSPSRQSPPEQQQQQPVLHANGVDNDQEEEKKDDGEEYGTATAAAAIVSSLSEDYDEDDDDQGEDDQDEDKEIRQSAEKLLQWAQYRSYAPRTSTSSPTHSVASGMGSAASSSPMVPRTIDAGNDTNNHTNNNNTDGVLSPSLSHDSAATTPTTNSNPEVKEEQTTTTTSQLEEKQQQQQEEDDY